MKKQLLTQNQNTTYSYVRLWKLKSPFEHIMYDYGQSLILNTRTTPKQKKENPKSNRNPIYTENPFLELKFQREREG